MLIPMQLGPIILILYLSIMLLSFNSASAPSSPSSLNTAAMQTTAFTPFLPQSSATERTKGEGTVITAISTSWGTSSSFLYPGISSTSSPFLLTTATSPL